MQCWQVCIGNMSGIDNTQLHNTDITLVEIWITVLTGWLISNKGFNMSVQGIVHIRWMHTH